MQKNQFTKTVIDLGLLEPSNILHSSEDDDATCRNSANARDYLTNKVSVDNMNMFEVLEVFECKKYQMHRDKNLLQPYRKFYCQ